MVGIIGAIILSPLAFVLVNQKFDVSVWGAILAAVIVGVACYFTGLLGCLFIGLVLGVFFKVDF